MIVLKIMGWFLLGVLLLLLLVLHLRLDLLIRRDEEKMRVSLRVIGLSFGGKQGKSKNKKLKQKKEKKELKNTSKKGKISTFLSIMGFYELSSKDALQKSRDKNGLVGVVQETALSVKMIFFKLGYILKNIHIRKLHITCISGGADAAKTAMEYGQICSILYPLLGYMTSVSPKKIRDVKTNIGCDFEKEKSVFLFDTVVSTRLIYSLWALLSLAVKNLLRAGKKSRQLKRG